MILLFIRGFGRFHPPSGSADPRRTLRGIALGWGVLLTAWAWLPEARGQLFDITFDEVAAVPVNGLNLKGVTFDFKVAGLDSDDAVFNATGPSGQLFSDLSVLEGDASGILTFDFSRPTPRLSFSAALNSSIFAATPGLTVDLFGIGLVPLGTLPLALISNGPGLWIEGQFNYPGGPPITRAVIDFLEANAGLPPRFLIDNLSFSVISEALRRPQAEPQPYLLIDHPAIWSANTSGLMMPAAHRQMLRGSSRTALRDLNARLYRARSRQPGDASAIRSADQAAIIHYLDFAARHQIPYQVALGLRDGEEREVAGSLHPGLPFSLAGPGMVPAGSVTRVVVPAPAGSVKNPAAAEALAPPSTAPGKAWEVFAAADFSSRDQGALTQVFRGFESQTWAGSIGIEWRPSSWSAVGLAYSNLESEGKLDHGLGHAELDAHLFSLYGTVFLGRTWADLLYSRGEFASELARRTLVGDVARADPESRAHHLHVNLGHQIPLAPGLVTGPMLGLEYTSGSTAGYAENGSPRANLLYDRQDYDSLLTRLGWQITRQQETPWGSLEIQGRAGWERENQPAGDRIRATLATSPFLLVTPGVGAERVGGYAASAPEPHPGSDWLALGTGLRFAFSNDLSLFLDYEAHLFQDDFSARYASLKLSWEF